jgi:hypothetical protein
MINSKDYSLNKIRWHCDLTPEERNLIKDSSECPLFEIIKGMNSEEQERIGEIFGYKSLKHYMSAQREWYAKERELLEWNRGKKPSEDELLEDITVKGTPIRFKLWYIAMFPEKVVIKGELEDPTFGNTGNDELNLAEEFLADANMVRPFSKL